MRDFKENLEVGMGGLHLQEASMGLEIATYSMLGFLVQVLYITN